jgi:hypothetical protein
MSSSLALSRSSPACRPEPAPAPAGRRRGAEFWDAVRPKEHGSWSLAFEPVALGLIAAPSIGGAWLAAAVAAGFFARRPLRACARETDPARRATAWRALGVCGGLAGAAFAAALATGGLGWVGWLLPTVAGGVVFAIFDARGAGREGVAEVAGAAAFGFLPAAFAVLGGCAPRVALALAFMMLARAVPTVLTVRACLRAMKTGRSSITGPLATTAASVAIVGKLDASGLVAWPWVALVGVLALRTGVLLVAPRPALRARTLGIIEAIAGVAFVVLAGVTAP